MIRIAVTGEVRAKAEERFRKSAIYRGSHRGADANAVGIIGEIVVEHYLGDRAIPVYSTSHDLLLGDKRVEVKTKERSVDPRPDFDCSVPVYSHDHQSVDIYIFVSLVRRNRKIAVAWLLGWCDVKSLYLHGTYHAKGTSDTNGIVFWTDCINIRIRRLNRIEELA